MAALKEPQRSEVKKVFNFIKKTFPNHKPFICYGMIGFGPTRYKTKAGKEGDWFKIGLASQKNYISLYACATVKGIYVAEPYIPKLPKANIGRSCIRFKKWDDLDPKIMRELLRRTMKAGFGF